MPKKRIWIKRKDRVKQRYWVGEKRRIPQKVGTLWYGQYFIHGPRYKKPLEFIDKRVYIVNQDWAEKRHLIVPKSIPTKIKQFAQKEELKLPKDYKDKMRLKVGTLKKTKKLGIQSFITPIK